MEGEFICKEQSEERAEEAVERFRAVQGYAVAQAGTFLRMVELGRCSLARRTPEPTGRLTLQYGTLTNVFAVTFRGTESGSTREGERMSVRKLLMRSCDSITLWTERLSAYETHVDKRKSLPFFFGKRGFLALRSHHPLCSHVSAIYSELYSTKLTHSLLLCTLLKRLHSSK